VILRRYFEVKVISISEETGKVRPIGIRNVATILILGTTGQIAWLLENSWFNTFVFDKITKDPSPIAWMVAVSAIVATVTTLVMGALSDRTRSRFGKRKPFIVFGYIAWGFFTSIFPITSWIQEVGIAVVMVVIVDAIMTFFGSTANDANFSAWVTDIGHSSNRNRIQTLTQLAFFFASVVGLGAAGVIIDTLGYFWFFYVLGGVVSVSGVIGAVLIKSQKSESESKISGSIWQDFKALVDPRILRENRILFLLFLNMAISGVASQVYTPYLYIFIQHYLGFSKTEMSMYLGIFIILIVIFLGAFGLISHKINRWTMIVFGTIVSSIMMILVGILAPSLRGNIGIATWAVILYFIGILPSFAASTAHGGWLQDTYPEGDVGKFQGVRMIFMVLVPMVIGPPIGAFIIETFGIADGMGGFIPTPEIFLVGGIISFFAIIPILFIEKIKGVVKLDVKN
jgi:MFS family permease